MKAEDEIWDERERMRLYFSDDEVNAVMQTLTWVLDEDNTMCPFDYVGLKKGREPIRK